MKKLLIALPVVAGTAWAGTSYLAGVQSESGYDQFLSQSQVMNPLVLEKESFDKGLTTSHAVTIVKESSSPDAQILLRLQHEINHSSVQMDEAGPAIATATIRTTLVENSVNTKYEHIIDNFKNDQPLEIITKAGINGNVHNKITVSAYEAPVKGGTETLSIEESVLHISSDSTRSSGEGTIGVLTFSDDKGNSMTSSPSELSFNIANQNPWGSEYEFLLNLAEFTVKSVDADEPMKASNFHLAANSMTDSDEIDYTAKIDIGNIDYGSLFPADSAPVTAGTVNVAVNNMKIETLNEFNDYYSQYSLSDRAALSENLDSEFLKEYAKLITKNSEISYDIALKNSAGNANADLLVRFIGDNSETGRDNIVSGADLGKAIEIDANVVADKAALELTPAIMMMQTLPAQIIFTDQGDQYVAKATVRELVANLNDQIYPLEELAGGMLEMPFQQLFEMGGAF